MQSFGSGFVEEIRIQLSDVLDHIFAKVEGEPYMIEATGKIAVREFVWALVEKMGKDAFALPEDLENMASVVQDHLREEDKKTLLKSTGAAH